jgi:hypothetical protein
MDDAAFNRFMVQVADGVSHRAMAGRYAVLVRVLLEIAGDAGPEHARLALAALRRGSPTATLAAVLADVDRPVAP